MIEQTEQAPGESLIEQLSGCLDEGETYSGNLEIIKKLVEEKHLVEELIARRNVLDIENAQFGNNTELSPEDEEAYLRGMIFELIGEAEAKKHTEEGDMLTAVMHNPTRNGLETVIPIVKNPDAVNAGFDMKSNILWLNSVVESKFGLLGYKAFRQVQTYESVMKMCIDRLSNLDLSKYGLEKLTEGGRTMRLSSDFYVVLIVPRDRDIRHCRSLINEDDFYDPGNVREFRHMLKKREKVKVYKSAFSTDEVVALEKVVAPLVRSARRQV